MAAIVAVCTGVPQHANAQLPQLSVVGNEIQDECGSKVILRGVSTEYLNVAAGSSGGVNALVDRLVNTEDNASNSPGWYTRIIRFPVQPSSWVQDPQGYLNNHLIPAVDKATDLGLYVIVDWHYVDDVNNGNNAANTAAFWETVAPVFKDYKNVWYELYNEPKMDLSWSQLRPYFQDWYDIVRNHAPNNIVLIGSETWSQNPQHGCDDPVIGTNIAYVAHMYANHFPWLNNTIIGATNCVPVIMTEWGFRDELNWDPQGGDEEDIATFGQPIMDMMENNGIHWTAWCASEDFEPAMFYPGWELRVGPGEMGGFVKDVLYEKRNDDQPCLDLDGPFKVNVTANGPGSVTISPDQSEFEGGSTVTITASADNGALFWGWTGVSGADNDRNTLTLEVTGNRSVTANFITPIAVPGKVEAEDYHDMAGIQTEETTDDGGGLNVGWTEPDDWMSYQINVAKTDHYDLLLRVAANGTGDSELEVLIDDQSVEVVTIPNTGGWQVWTDVYLFNIPMETGLHELKILSTSSGWNLNYVLVGDSIVSSVPSGNSSQVKLYPNPANHVLNLATVDQVNGVITNVAGAVVQSFDGPVVDVSALDSGLYFVQIETKDGPTQIEFVKK